VNPHPESLTVAIGVALAIGACGSASKPHHASSSGTPAAALRLAACMRSHGVPNFPDPTANAAAPPPGTINKHSPAYIAAANACESTVVGAGPPAARTRGAPSITRQVALLKLASCIRSRGVPDFPDHPTASALAIYKRSPVFIAAARACGTHGTQMQLSP